MRRRVKGNKSKRKYIIYGVLFVILILSIFTYLSTGIFQINSIDERDLERWERESDGVVVNSREFYLDGNKENCWLLIHGYTSTPDEMKILARNINGNFSDYVYVIRLKGHGELPSKVYNLTLEDWYIQVEEEYNRLDGECGNVNVAGFSFGGALATKLSEEKNVGRTYLIAPYLFTSYRKSSVISLDFVMSYFSDILLYIKKDKIAQINDPQGQISYISYWNFPLIPVKYSRDFLDSVINDLDKIKNPILIQHSIGDMTANIKGSRMIYERALSEDKVIVELERSNHVLLSDYEKEEVIKNIIDFEYNYR